MTPHEKRFVHSALFILIAIGLVGVFAYFGSEVAEGESQAVDLFMVQYAKELRTSHLWLPEVLRDLSGLGSTVVLALFTAGCVGYLALFSSRMNAVLVATSVATGTLLVSVFKALLGRARPAASYAEFVASGLSFPSGHSTMSALVFLTIGTVIANTRSQLGEKIYILAAASFMSILVGLSRVGLGVHWATDVIGGWSFGVAWAILWLVIAHWLLRRVK
jgi:undecaprenyl-diphosphatase